MQSDFSCTPQGTDAHHAPQGQHHNPHWPKGSGQKHHASAIDGKSPKELLGLLGLELFTNLVIEVDELLHYAIAIFFGVPTLHVHADKNLSVLLVGAT